MRNPDMGPEDPIEQREPATDIEPKMVVPTQEGEFSAEKKIETERREFLDAILLNDMDSFRNELCGVFGADRRHAPPFLTDLVFTLNSNQLQELRDIAADYDITTGCRALKDMLKELNSVYQKGENAYEVFIDSLKLEDYQKPEELKKRKSEYDPKKSFKEGNADYLDLKKNFAMYAEIIRIFTGKQFTSPDFIPEDAKAADLKGNEQLGQYIEQVNHFFDELVKEKVLKYPEICSKDWGKSTEELLTAEGIEGLKYFSEGSAGDQEIRALCNERLRQFAESQPLKGKRTFEIGGTALKDLLSRAGTEAVSFDATGFDWEKWGKTTAMVSNTMNMGNHREILDKIDPNDPEHKFDLTTSRMVFDEGSGIESTVASGKYEQAADEVLRILADITKPGGLSIHQLGFKDGKLFGDDEEKKLAEIGFEKVSTIKANSNELLQKHPFFVRPPTNRLRDYIIAESLQETQPDFEYPTVVLRKK